MTPNDFKARTLDFGPRIVKLVRCLPKNTVGYAIGNQSICSGTSVGANYRAACRARSRVEFVSRMAIVEEEADETAYWLELLIRAEVMKSELLQPLLKEATEICSVASRSRKTARKNAGLMNAKAIRNRQSTIDNSAGMP